MIYFILCLSGVCLCVKITYNFYFSSANWTRMGELFGNCYNNYFYGDGNYMNLRRVR